MDDHLVLRPHNPYPDSLSPPSSQQDLISHLDRLKFFLATAPSRWSATDVAPDAIQHPALNRFLLPSGEYVTCVLWSGLYHITGTDIVRALVFRFEAFGRPVRNLKKFEEGVFSDLRNLKPGHDACLEEPKSPFLDLLFKYQCIRTQKKQKVFYWFSVPHDRLFLDALERDLKREKIGLEPTTSITAEPAASFSYDPKRSLFEQFVTPDVPPSPDQQFFNMLAGSPTYKQRRKKAPKLPRRLDVESDPPVQWAQSPAYGTLAIPLPSPESEEGSQGGYYREEPYHEAAYYAPEPEPEPEYYTAPISAPLSAPSTRVEFDIYPTAPAPAARRPRSVTPSLPASVRLSQHVRRPSTATERGQRYHPYAAPTPVPAAFAYAHEYTYAYSQAQYAYGARL